MELNLVVTKLDLTREEADQVISDVAADACAREGCEATGAPYFVEVDEHLGAPRYRYRVPTDRPEI